MAHPLMPKATAVWLIDNTTLTFNQIADFCGLHELEVQALADGEVAPGMHGLDPVARDELTQDELDRCQADSSARLVISKTDKPQPKARSNGARYTPVSKRADRPNAIAWLLKNYSELTDAQISKLIGTTKPTINAIRDRTHWNTLNIKPQNPVGLGLCSGDDLEKSIALGRARTGKRHAPGAATAPDGVVPPDTPEPALATEHPVAMPPAVEPANEEPAEPFTQPDGPGVQSKSKDIPKDPWATD